MNTKRIYGVNIDDTEIDYINCTDEQFIEEAEIHGLVWEDISLFLSQLNNEDINTNYIQFRYI
jgi:hypothetical protein